MVVVVIAMCPVIMFSSEALASDIQRYTQTLVEKTKELNLEKHKTDTLPSDGTEIHCGETAKIAQL